MGQEANTAKERQKHLVTREGVVVSTKMQKTICVQVNRLVLHPVIKKYIRRKTRFLVHDEKKEARVGSRVKIEETRPISRKKRWRLVKVLSQNQVSQKD